MTSGKTIEAAFMVGNRWQWHKVVVRGNKHAAIIDKANELGATRWDFGSTF